MSRKKTVPTRGQAPCKGKGAKILKREGGHGKKGEGEGRKYYVQGGPETGETGDSSEKDWRRRQKPSGELGNHQGISGNFALLGKALPTQGEKTQLRGGTIGGTGTVKKGSSLSRR